MCVCVYENHSDHNDKMKMIHLTLMCCDCNVAPVHVVPCQLLYRILTQFVKVIFRTKEKI